MAQIWYHTRHIPEEQLRLDTRAGKLVKEALLCDVMQPEYSKVLVECGVSVIETRLIWWELEKEPGIFDWSVIDNRFDSIEKAGLQPGLFSWFMHAPSWEHDMVRAKCLEHCEKSSIISLWEPRLLETYDRLYGALAKHFGSRIKFLYFSFYGDFGEPQYPHNTEHYKFSSKHAHYGYWSGDDLARADYRNYLRKKYITLDKLSEAWNESVSDWNDDLMPSIPLVTNTLEKRRDYQLWYCGCMVDFCDKAAAIIRKHFPDIRAAYPMGGTYERLQLGQIHSQVIKAVAGKYNLLVRDTCASNARDFGSLNFAIRKMSTPARFYKSAGFGTEVGLGLTGDMAHSMLYVNLCNGSSLLHNEVGGIIDGKDVYVEWKDKLPLLPVNSEIAVYWPLEGEQLECLTLERAQPLPDGKDFSTGDNCLPDLIELVQTMANFRRKCDYEIADSYLISDGILNSTKELLILSECPVPLDTAKIIIDWVESGGRLWCLNSGEPWILETREPLSAWLERRLASSSKGSIHLTDALPEFEPYTSIRKQYADGDAPVYVTLHGNGYSVYLPDKKQIIVNAEG